MTHILITGASGAAGTALLEELAGNEQCRIVATDINEPPGLPSNAVFEHYDVREKNLPKLLKSHQIDVVVHLASIVTPGPQSTREHQYSVDVQGSKNVLEACIEQGVRRLVVSSSGAAYGYHHDNPAWLTESDPLRGNPAFAYADHKRQVEEMLALARKQSPQLEQVILRIATVLGPQVDNQITALFRKPRLLGVRGSDSPFVFIWTRDLARILSRAATDAPAGVFNVAGDGALSVDDLAQAMQKRVLKVPAWLLRAGLFIAQPLKLSRYGPEQVKFLQYRPVLDNTALKEVFSYQPEKTSAEVFDLWWRSL